LRLKDSSISPGVFIQVAEQSGLIGAIGRLVLHLVIEQIANWKKQFSLIFPISINLSSKQLDDSNLVVYISNLLQEYEVSPSAIQIEVTESAIIEKGSRAIAVLAELKAMGIATSIDDFGSGQSGINYLTQFHVNQVKLDKTFIDKYLNEKWMEVFNSVVHLCHLMGFEVLAEGIETAEQVTLLQKTKCKLAQGFYYYRPLPVEKIEVLLSKEWVDKEHH
jgi:EAL domain-containing protein (putative c-di-GMP-specific phosphodiesterase class I)